MGERLTRAFLAKITLQRLILFGFEEKIKGRNPIRILDRGYAIIEKDGRVIKSMEGITGGDCVRARMKGGLCDLKVRRVIHDKDL